MDIATIIAIVAALGGIGGFSAFFQVFSQRRKFKAEAADVLTGAALELIEPLQARVRELEQEARATRAEVAQARSEARALKDEVVDLAAVLRRWRTAILTRAISREDLERMVREDSLPTILGAVDTGHMAEREE